MAITRDDLRSLFADLMAYAAEALEDVPGASNPSRPTCRRRHRWRLELAAVCRELARREIDPRGPERAA